MSEKLISNSGESDKASQLYQRHTELAASRAPYTDHLDSLAEARTRLDQIKDGGLRSRIANRQEAKQLKTELHNNQQAVDSPVDGLPGKRELEYDPRDAYNKFAGRIQKNYDTNIKEAQRSFNPDNQEAFYDDAAEMNAEFIKNEAVTALASKFHEQWRSDRLQEDGTYEPREKPTKDAAWIEAHGTDVVDIANTDFANLPKDWQAENVAAAGIVVDLLATFNGNIDLSDESTRNDVGDIVHTAWLARNEWAKGSDLDVPFADLSAEEQAKDINQVSTALEVFKN